MRSVAAALKVQRAINMRRAVWKLGYLSTLTAAVFLSGAGPISAEAYERKGARLGTFARAEGEALIAFRNRVREAAHALPGASIGFHLQGASAGVSGLLTGIPRDAIVLPYIPPHPSQLEALKLIRGNKRFAR